MTRKQLARKLKIQDATLDAATVRSKPLTKAQLDLLELVLEGLPVDGDFLGENIDDEINNAKSSWDWDGTSAERKQALDWINDRGYWLVRDAHEVREIYGSRGLGRLKAWLSRTK